MSNRPYDPNLHRNSSPFVDVITHLIQPECAQAIEVTNCGASSVEVVAGCGVCGKSLDQVQFSKSQSKRLKKGKIVTCKACAGLAGSSGSAASSVAVGVRASPISAKFITGTESLSENTVSI